MRPRIPLAGGVTGVDAPDTVVGGDGDGVWLMRRNASSLPCRRSALALSCLSTSELINKDNIPSDSKWDPVVNGPVVDMTRSGRGWMGLTGLHASVADA